MSGSPDQCLGLPIRDSDLMSQGPRNFFFFFLVILSARFGNLPTSDRSRGALPTLEVNFASMFAHLGLEP